MSIADVIDRLLDEEDLGRDGATQALSRIMAGQIDPIQTAAFLIGLRAKGETASELAGLVTAVRDHSTKVQVDHEVYVDTCGTGGGVSTFNVSTAAAFVVAGAGVVVAKHGNRSSTSKSGSADVLEALGAVVDLPSDAVTRSIDETGIGFMFAPSFHPAFRHVVPVRRALAVRTVFNILGPLANPAGVRHQVIGIADRAYLDRIAMAIAELGTDRTILVSSDDGMDELSTSAPSEVVEITAEGVRRWRFDPADLRIPPPPHDSLLGGEPAQNADVIRRILEGGQGPSTDIVALNAAAGLVAAGVVDDIADGYDLARSTIESGHAAERLVQFSDLTTRLAST